MKQEIFWDDLEYKKPWKEVSVHDDNNVKGFFGQYRWLSNFHPSPVEYQGLLYPRAENAYQAAKVPSSKRQPFLTCTAKESKLIWREIGSMFSPEEWDAHKNKVMAKVVFDKFLRNLDLRSLLIETKDKYLEETLWWRDTWFGVDIKLGGKNYLGRILMATRSYFSLFPESP